MTDSPQTLCPNCGRPYNIQEFHRRAEEFCPNPECDYPLFWAPNSIVVQPPESSEVDAMRRQPGTTGLGTQASHRCPDCGELNDARAVSCWRCGADLRPALPAPPPKHMALPPPHELPPPLPDPSRWPLVLAGTVLIVILVLLGLNIWIW